MKRWIFALVVAGCLFGSTRNANAFFSINFGLMDNDQFGYGLGFGLYTPVHLGFEERLLGFYDSGGAFDRTWFRSDINLFYDFNAFMPEGTLKNFYPKALFGFGYGSFFLSNVNVGGTQQGIRSSYGPGISFGTGFDWKFDKMLAFGLDFFESVNWLDGATVGSSVIIPDETRWGFNMMFSVKLFDI